MTELLLLTCEAAAPLTLSVALKTGIPLTVHLIKTLGLTSTLVSVTKLLVTLICSRLRSLTTVFIFGIRRVRI